ncbi:MAG: glycosyltransferase [Elusimicrobiota bacterium]
MTQWNKKILTVLMEWDYCDPKRGPSNDKAWFYDNFAKLASVVEPFWYDAYVHDIPGLRNALIEKARSFNPDLIFFLPYTGQFDSKTLDLLKSDWPTCAWFGDDTWRFSAFSSKLAPHFTHVCTTDIFSVEKYRKIGVKPILTQWAAQPLATPVAPLQAGEKHRYQVSFVGARNSVRNWFINVLRGKGISVECFGHDWPNGQISRDEMAGIFRESKVNLNLSNSATPDFRYLLASPRNLISYMIADKTSEQIKARNFEIPLSGGFQLTNYVAGIERYLKIGEEVAVFSSPEECVQQIKYYLQNETERASITAAGHARAAAEHTYLRRLEKVFSEIWP